MTIYQRQYNQILQNEIIRYLLQGRQPSTEEISKRLSAALSRDGNITYQFIPQPRREVFQHEIYNDALRNIKFDVDLFHQESLFLIQELVKRVSYADLTNKVNTHEINNLQSILESILFSVENADFYFAGAFDNFTDISKTNQDESTQDVVDLKEQALALPFGGRGTAKIKTNHMFGINSWPVTLGSPAETIIREGIVPGTKWENIFTDLVNAWAYEVVTDQAGPAELAVTFPIAGSSAEEIEVFVNRIELIPHSPKSQTITILVSNDDVNYLPIAGYESGVTVDDQRKVYGLDFETNLVQYVRVIFRKESPDEELSSGTNKEYQYVFGLKNMSFYSTGRINRASYVSKPFDFAEEEENIAQVALQANYEKPANTIVEFSVALANDTGLLSQYIPITPIGSESKVGTNKIVKFGNTQPNSRRMNIPPTGDDAPIQYGREVQGKSFYRIGKPIDPKPVFSTGKLFRGFNSWYRDSSNAFEVKEIQDVYVSFAESNTESIYDLKLEAPTFTALSNRRGKLTLSENPYYNPDRGHLIIPDPSLQGASRNIAPNYAVYSVTQASSVNRFTQAFTLGFSRTAPLPSTNFVLDTATVDTEPVISLANGTILQRGVDYEYETDQVGGIAKPTGRITIIDGSSLLNSSGQVASTNQNLVFAWTPDPDITHKVTNIQGKSITLENVILQNQDSITIEYRFIPKLPNEIIKSSVRVANLPSTGAIRDFFVEGKDYSFNAATGNIQRIPGGDIEETGTVYVDFSYRNAEEGIETFYVWCNITNPDGAQIFFSLDPATKDNLLVADSSVGERFFVNTRQGLIDLTNATNTPILEGGWVQFVVRSKNPDANTGFRSNLIDQVIQLRNTAQRRVFKENGDYFRQITAFREPMTEISLNQLRVNTLKSDHTVFAVDSLTNPNSPYIVLNFLPNTTTELYSRAPDDELIADKRPDTINEQFVFTWQNKVEQENPGNKLVVKIDLQRDPAKVDAGVTPKVFDYKLRVGF